MQNHPQIDHIRCERRERRGIGPEVPALMKALKDNEVVKLILDTVDFEAIPSLLSSPATLYDICDAAQAQTGYVPGTFFSKELIEGYIVVLVDNYILDQMQYVIDGKPGKYFYVRYTPKV